MRKFKDVIILVLLVVFSNPGFSQRNTTKAEIKKPQFTIAGIWSVGMEIRDNKKKGILSEFIYEFKRDGTYEYSYIYKSEKKPEKDKKNETLFVMEKGRWLLTDGGKTLRLETDTLTTQGINMPTKVQPYSLGNAQVINQEDSQRFTIKKVESGETIEYVYFRRMATWSGKIGPAIPPKK